MMSVKEEKKFQTLKMSNHDVLMSMWDENKFQISGIPFPAKLRQKAVINGHVSSKLYGTGPKMDGIIPHKWEQNIEKRYDVMR